MKGDERVKLVTEKYELHYLRSYKKRMNKRKNFAKHYPGIFDLM